MDLWNTSAFQSAIEHEGQIKLCSLLSCHTSILLTVSARGRAVAVALGFHMGLLILIDDCSLDMIQTRITE